MQGLAADEEVVTSANFLVDSESKLNAVLNQMGEPNQPSGGHRMIDKIIEFSAKNKFIVIFFTIAAIVGAVYCIQNMPLDAIPDLSDTQVIIYSQWDRSPDIIEDQVTYPIVTAMLGAPNVKAIRGFSDFGFSYVYVIFKDGTDIYWARSRTMEYLSKITARLPQGVQTEIGPDATASGLGLSVCPGGQVRQQQSCRSAQLSGLVFAVLAARACRASPRSPPSAAFRSSTR